MKQAGLIVVLAVCGFVAYRCYQHVPWIDVAAYVHSQRGSIDCGHISEPHINDAEAAIHCAISARQNGRPVAVIFSVYGTDERVSNAIVGDAKGNGLELFYGTGMLENANKLLKHSCAAPIQLQVDTSTSYHIPRLHCAPWPSRQLQRDHLLW